MALNDGAQIGAALPVGEWLYRQGDVLLGPVGAARIVELLDRGDLDASSPVAPAGAAPTFRPIGEVEAFRVALAMAQARRRVEAQRDAQHRRERRRHFGRLAVAGLAVGLLVLGGVLLAVHKPWQAHLAAEPVIQEDVPTVRMASRRGADDDEIAYPRAGANGAPSSSERATRPGRSAPRANPAAPLRDDDVNSRQLWDGAAINAVVRANKPTLHGCLVAESRRRGGDWAAAVPIEFTVGNDGRVTKLWIDNPEFKTDESELYRCMLGELKKWRFPSYPGEQANVSLSFRIQGR